MSSNTITVKNEETQNSAISVDFAKSQEKSLEEKPMHTIYNNMLHAQRLLMAEGISKKSQNKQQDYKYRGINEVYAVLPRVLNQADLLIQPNVVDIEVKERGKATHVVMTVDYIISNSYGQECTRRVYGEALDYSDKAVNKAMTSAYKYFLFQAFCIPVEGIEDADAEHIEVENPNINDHQIQEMRDLLDKLGKKEEAYCAHFGLEQLADIPKESFASAKGALEELIQKSKRK